MADYIEHLTGELERWDTLAWRYYGDATRYEPIIAANPHLAITPVLPSGVRIYIPILDNAIAAQPSSAPPWLR
jgi:phage tail protein X